MKPGHDLRPIGCDIAEGERVLAAGDRLGPAELGLLAAVGVTKVKVYQRPTVGVLSTGNEVCQQPRPFIQTLIESILPCLVHYTQVVNPGESLKPGQIYDSNRSTLLASLNEQGFPATDIGIASDDRESLMKMIGQSLAEHDVIITSGGVSMGEKVSHFMYLAFYHVKFYNLGVPFGLGEVLSFKKL